jgi:hypothetical protein
MHMYNIICKKLYVYLYKCNIMYILYKMYVK